MEASTADSEVVDVEGTMVTAVGFAAGPERIMKIMSVRGLASSALQLPPDQRQKPPALPIYLPLICP
ncbi:hypothetical protein RchiOBHm_Chr3g0485791 [Rosa chinensis]|uniref:Uncharacterized protein n=1 Tax=Rosa chinensis TaxID=74649 RepID=A0A2P6RF35_ROSCH|nr:hypothetical protein RchiOBHm_Chr3g0485791 [Rosa chinensis]